MEGFTIKCVFPVVHTIGGEKNVDKQKLKVNLICLRECSNPLEMLKYYFFRIFKIRYSFNEDMFMDNGDGYFNCGKEMETCKACCSLIDDEFKQVIKGLKGNMVDCGSHVGRYSILMSRETGNSGTVFAIEPFEESLRLLKENLKINLTTNIHIFPKLLSDTVKDCVFYLKDKFPGGNSLYNETENKIHMKSTTLDILLDGVENISFIKIDVEGAELDVLKGGLNIIEKHKPIIYFEATSSEKLVEVTKFLNKLGYSVSQINEDNYLAEVNK